MLKKYVKLNSELLSQVKRAFVSMPAGSDPATGAGPVAGGGLMTQAQAAPMGAPMDPAAAGGGAMPPIDPTAGGGGAMPPMDPAAAGGGAMPPMDPAAAGGGGGELPPEAMAMLMGGGEGGGGGDSGSKITLTVDELIRLIEGVGGAVKGKKQAPAPDPAAAGAGPGGAPMLPPEGLAPDPGVGAAPMPPMEAGAMGGAMPPMG